MAGSFLNFTFCLSLVFVFIQNYFVVCTCFDFDRNYFGVILETDVHNFSGEASNIDHARPQGLYSFETIKTMLTVIMGKFSKVFVSDPLTTKDKYTKDFTYLRESRLAAFVGEAAAIINEKAGIKNLTVMYDLHSLETSKKMETSTLLAFEAATRANKRFPGTVEGICFDGKSNVLSQQTLNDLRSYRDKATSLGVKLGARLRRTDINNENKIGGTVQQIVKDADFIVFDIILSKQNFELGPLLGFQSMQGELLRIRETVRQVNPSTDVIAITQWSGSAGDETLESVEDLQRFWETTSGWAAEHKYSIYLWEAFDNPGRARTHSTLAHLGWWRLQDVSKINDVDGYIEKIAVLGNSSVGGPITENSVNSVTSGVQVSSTEPMSTTIADEEYEDEATANSPPVVVWNEATIALTAVGSMLVVVVSALLVFLMYRHKFQKRTACPKTTIVTESEIRDFMMGTSNGLSIKGTTTTMDAVMTIPYDISWEIPKDKLRIDTDHVLGSGQYGCVYKAVVHRDGGKVSEVAVKVATNNCPSLALKGLLSEIKILSYLGKHDNVVSLEGAYTAELINGVVYVATELCGLGSLESFLRRDGKIDLGDHRTVVNKEGFQEIELHTFSTISLFDMLRWAAETARGMQYLERKHVVHADLATRNILLTCNKTAKITDFGLSRKIYNYMTYVKTNQEPLPWRWMSVESLKRLEFSSKSDVWSYGVTLWEIFSKGDIPYPGLSWTQDYVNNLQDGLRPNCPKFSSVEIYNVMLSCWNLAPEKRPNFGDVAEIFEKFMQNPENSHAQLNLYQ